MWQRQSGDGLVYIYCKTTERNGEQVGRDGQVMGTLGKGGYCREGESG